MTMMPWGNLLVVPGQVDVDVLAGWIQGLSVGLTCRGIGGRRPKPHAMTTSKSPLKGPDLRATRDRTPA